MILSHPQAIHGDDPYYCNIATFKILVPLYSHNNSPLETFHLHNRRTILIHMMLELAIIIGVTRIETGGATLSHYDQILKATQLGLPW